MFESGALTFIALVLLIFCGVVSVYLYKLNRKLHGEISTLNTELLATEGKLKSLDKYTAIANADAELSRIENEIILQKRNAIESINSDRERIINQAKLESQRLLSDANASKLSADSEVKELLSNAKKKANEIKEKAQQVLNESGIAATQIISDAKSRAEEIAGEALSAKGKAEQYEQAAKAMKHVIDGYGDEYVIPSRSVLDELAEYFGFQEAGQALSKARKHTVALIKSGLAADCDYVEMHRKNYAIRFVLDAFNGKVDTALTKVKQSNVGKLKQEILDAYNLVNHNGSAFRNARIRKQYLDSRLDELHWASVVLQLQLDEREEQRRIKEAIREEEKAKREYEKAVKEAENEEKILEKAMEKAYQQLKEATEAQRLDLENQLTELQRKLQEAKAKEQRALSMAQQTKRGHVYIISNIGSFGEEVLKIGLTRRLEPEERIRELGDASVPFPFDIHAMIFCEDAPSLETELHRKFQNQQVNMVNPRKEFFRVNISDLKVVIDKMGYEAHWTLVAEAREYNESMALKKQTNCSNKSPLINCDSCSRII